MIAIQNWTSVTYSTEATTTDEQALRERLHTAFEKAVDAYMSESKEQSITAVDVFPTGD